MQGNPPQENQQIWLWFGDSNILNTSKRQFGPQRRRTHQLTAFASERSATIARVFAKRTFYSKQTAMEWYFKMRVLFLGQTGLQTDVQCIAFFANLAEDGNHLYADSVYGKLMTISCVRRKPGSEITAHNPVPINEVLPCIHYWPTTMKDGNTCHRLVIGRQYRLTNRSEANRCNGRCGRLMFKPGQKPKDENGEYEAFGGVLDIEESYRPHYDPRKSIDHMNGIYFGIYVCDGAKLVVFDECMICKPHENPQKNMQVHHNRTLALSGAFLIFEGQLTFRFASLHNSDIYYTAKELEDNGAIAKGSITGRTHPVFFLSPQKSTHNTRVWSVGHSNNAFEDKLWYLNVSEGSCFAAIEEYADAVHEVIFRQSCEPAPYEQNVISKGLRRTMNQKSLPHYLKADEIRKVRDSMATNRTVSVDISRFFRKCEALTPKPGKNIYKNQKNRSESETVVTQQSPTQTPTQSPTQSPTHSPTQSPQSPSPQEPAPQMGAKPKKQLMRPLTAPPPPSPTPPQPSPPQPSPPKTSPQPPQSPSPKEPAPQTGAKPKKQLRRPLAAPPPPSPTPPQPSPPQPLPPKPSPQPPQPSPTSPSSKKQPKPTSKSGTAPQQTYSAHFASQKDSSKKPQRKHSFAIIRDSNKKSLLYNAVEQPNGFYVYELFKRSDGKTVEMRTANSADDVLGKHQKDVREKDGLKYSIYKSGTNEMIVVYLQ